MNANLVGKALEWVVWRDHFTTGDWRDLNDADLIKPDLSDSIGWVLAEDDARLVLVQTVSRDHPSIRNTLTIEKSCIEGRRTL